MTLAEIAVSYDDMIADWQRDPEGFWGTAARELSWARDYDTVLDTSEHPSGRWFSGGRINTCYNALDRHVAAGNGDRAALICHSAMTGDRLTLSYATLLERVAKLAGALRAAGVSQGDRVIIYMPMVPQAVIAMLACARIGAVHSVVFGGFAARELADRIDDAKPKVVLSASCGLEPGRTVAYKPLLDEALRLATHDVQLRVILQRAACPVELAGAGEVDWNDFEAGGEPVPCVDLEATAPLYILYTSGTTGRPKGIVRDNGGHAVALHWSMGALYGIDPADVFWAASDIGWVVGHSYIVYGPLLRGATTVLYEGKPVGTPDARAFWEVVADYKVKALFTAPTAMRAIKREDPTLALTGGYDLSCLQALFLAGERCDPDTLEWAGAALNVPVIDHWWQTETGWALTGNPLGVGLFAVRPGSAGKAMPGWNMDVVDADGQSLPPGETGRIVCRLPLGPGALLTLWNDSQRFENDYLSAVPGCYLTGDAGFIDSAGYIYVMTRIDDVINVAGHRLTTGTIEEVLASHPAVAECAVVGQRDALKGEVPFGFVCIKAQADALDPDTVVAELVQRVRDRIGPVAAFKQAIIVQRLPKTRSGKVLRGVMRKILNHEPWGIPPTIDDPAILSEISDALAARRKL
ncbi:MAG: AMP-binding protein [Gammaproteobacteria bacterium]|nr:AMP-binding protein [Gammaproteobacteria bacterium]